MQFQAFRYFIATAKASSVRAATALAAHRDPLN